MDSKGNEKKQLYEQYDWGKKENLKYSINKTPQEKTVNKNPNQVNKKNNEKKILNKMMWVMTYNQFISNPVLPISCFTAFTFIFASGFSLLKKYPAIISKRIGNFAFVSKFVALGAIGYYLFYLPNIDQFEDEE